MCTGSAHRNRSASAPTEAGSVMRMMRMMMEMNSFAVLLSQSRVKPSEPAGAARPHLMKKQVRLVVVRVILSV